MPAVVRTSRRTASALRHDADVERSPDPTSVKITLDIYTHVTRKSDERAADVERDG